MIKITEPWRTIWELGYFFPKLWDQFRSFNHKSNDLRHTIPSKYNLKQFGHYLYGHFRLWASIGDIILSPSKSKGSKKLAQDFINYQIRSKTRVFRVHNITQPKSKWPLSLGGALKVDPYVLKKVQSFCAIIYSWVNKHKQPWTFFF